MDPIIPTNDDPPAPTPTPEPPPRPTTRITCGFCGCSLAPSGDVLKMSPEAKAFRDAADDLDDARAALDKAQADLAAAQSALDEAKRTAEAQMGAKAARTMFNW